MKRRKFSHAIMLLLVGVIFFFLFTSLLAFFTYTRPTKIVSGIVPKDLGLQYEEVSFVTTDNIRLHGWFIPSAKQTNVKTIIALHGWPADKGDILPIVSFLSEEYNLLLFDFRYLGKSEGTYSTLGAKEREDLLAAVRYLSSRGIQEVGVWGFSMGGAVAFMTATQATEIKAIIAEASYARLSLMTPEVFRIPVARHALGWFVGLWARIFLGIDIEKVAPVESVKHLKIPILLIHSMDDQVIPFSHAQLLQEALQRNPNAEFWFQENLFHGQFSPEYQERITDFFARSL